jgi:DNA replication licensing factor MCM6
MSRFDLFFVILDDCIEQTDRNLAQHIVDVHQLRDDAVQPEFSTAELQRYIEFARTFKPEFSVEARKVLVEKYKELRLDDANGGVGRNSYRITVRQLESMIRLSEAIAKANCMDEITPAFVVEAYGLLRQSIISVEHDDVEIWEEDNQETHFVNDDTSGVDDTITQRATPDTASHGGVDGKGEDEKAAHRRFNITYEKYSSLVNFIVQQINDDEEGAVDGDVLIQSYLNHREEDILHEDEYHREAHVARLVLKKMIQVSCLCDASCLKSYESNIAGLIRIA